MLTNKKKVAKKNFKGLYGFLDFWQAVSRGFSPASEF
jgi:hypothetical protein